MIKRFTFTLLTTLVILLVAACGGTNHPVSNACTAASHHRGAMGICAPSFLRLTNIHPTVPQGVLFEDRSNNNPCYCGAAIKAAGYHGLVVKALQGGWSDPTQVGMVNSARVAGLAVGLYDFDQNYSLAEAQLLVHDARLDGINPSSRNTFPLTFDIEYGFFSLSGLKAQIAYVQSQGYRVQIYTGAWYWVPHAGNVWVGLPAWLAGYPNAVLFSGLPSSLFIQHQFTEFPLDQSVYMGSLTSFEKFVNNAPPVTKIVCWGPKAQIHNTICKQVRPELSHLSHARDSSKRALAATNQALQNNQCRKPYRRGICIHKGHDAAVFNQRVKYFSAKAHQLFIQYA